MTVNEGLDFEKVLDRIINVTEKNLKMQSEFLFAIQELKGRFDSVDRDHKENTEDVKLIMANTFDIITKMNISPNEKIIQLVEQLEKKIATIDSLKSSIEKGIEYSKDTSDSFKLIKRTLGVIALLVLGFQIIFGLYQTNKNDVIIENFKKEVQENGN